MENWGWLTWDYGDLNAGFDSAVPVLLQVATNGNETLNVGTQPQITYQGDSIDSIQSVVFQAAVTQQGEATWSDVGVECFDGSTLVQTVVPTSAPDANTMNTLGTPQAEQS